MNFTFFEEDFLFFASHNYCTIYGLRRFITLRTQITMEDEMVANVQNMKIEVEEVKVEMAEVNSESFGIEQNSCGLVVEDDHDERTDRIIDLQRIKEEHNYVKTRSNKEVLEMQGKKIKVEESWEDPKPFDPIYITEEDTFKVEQNDVLIDGNAKTALNSGPQQEIQRQNPEVCKKPRDELYSCYNCNYSTFYKYHLIKHMKLHCNTKFVSKKKLDNHAVRKHPNFIEPISSKIQECSQCTFATAQKSTLDKHMLKHSETKDELKMCMDCDRVFKNERWLVNHRIKQHSDSIQVFKCIHCTYKTTLNSSFDRHMLKHLGTTDDHMAASDLYDCKHCTYKTSLKTNFKRHKLKHFKRENRYRCVCAHCGLTLISLRYRDEHVVRKHPDSIASITRKIYKCKYCSYKTTLNQRLSNHILKHPETVDSSKLHNCTHCGASFKSKKSIDEHMVKRHPDFIASVSSKIHVCKYCTYKSTVSYRFAKHMLKHSGAVRHKYRKCTQCGAAFTSKAGLDDHTIRKHPDFIGSISRKIHACILCSYKTTLKSTLTRHTRQHYPEIRRNFKLNSCSHCTATFASKQNLNEHALQKHPYVNSTVTSKIHKCTFCPYKTTIKYNIDKHMMSKQHSQESQVTVISTNTRKLKRCNHCDAVFKRRENLDNHIVMKHPDFAASVSRKIHACKYCTYKTTMKYRITKHERKHTLNHIKAPKAHRLTHKSGQCTRCGAAFKSKRGLDDHTIRKHPDLIGFITCKIHVCTLCPYKTTLKCNLTEHMLQHYPKTCSHCKATFKSKLGLDDHTLREHPHVTSTVTSKIYKCILCPYETAIKYNIDNHMSKQHSQESQVTSTNTRKLKMCNHCDAVFKRRENLDNHIVMKHPDFAASVSCKIHACKYCTYKTAISYHITKHERKHMLNHLKAPKAHRLKHKSGKCTQCGAAFKSKAGLDEHTIRKHPDFIGFITCKILVCTLCSYKTTFKASLTRHMSKHSETQESPKPLSSCSQCKVTFKSKQSLDKHICGASVNIIVFHQNKKVFQRKMYYRRFFYCTILYLFITMEDEMAAIVQNMKIEVEEVKVEVAEVNIESFGIEQNSWRLAVEEEHNYVKAKSNMEIFEMQGEKIKVEENWEDCKPFEPMYITEEDIFKLEKNDDLIDGNAKIALNSGLQQEIQRQNPEVCEIPRDGLYSCYNYNYSTFYKYHLIKHMKLHCNTKFASKEKLDNHAVRKHPDFIEPISSKIQECSQCTFATAQKATLDKHMLKHSETKDELKMCMDCDRVFKNERWLVNHIIKEHSDSIQVFKCIHCTYKTNLKSSFDRHMFKHLGTTDDHMAASDLYDCKHCTYKTSLKTNFKRHKLKHSKRANRYRCITMEDEMAAIVQNMKIEVEEVKMEMAEVDIEITEEHNYVKAKSNMEVFEMQGEKIKVEENWEDCKSFEPMYITEEDLFKLEKNDDLIDGTAIIALNSGPQQEIQRQNPEVCKKPRDELYSCYNCNYSTFYKYHLIKHMKLHCSTKFASKKNLDNHANMKIEVEEVKVEMAEVNIESFGIEQISWGLAVQGDHDERTDRIIDLQRMKEEHNYVKTRSNMEVLEVQGEKIKVEENWEDYKPFDPLYFNTEEDTIKLEKNDDLIDGNTKPTLNSDLQQELQRQNLEVCKKSRDKLYSCYNCNYSTFYKYHLIKHMKLHCNTKFASKKKLGNHAIRKHPDFIESMHVCTLCSYKTNLKSRLKNHMLQHYPETLQNFKLSSCGHCKATFKSKTSLDDHILRKHPQVMSTVTSKIHKCTLCPYKTTRKFNLTKHMWQHYPETRQNFKLSSCSHCKATFKSKKSLDDHTLRKHPHVMSTVTSKIHKCTRCPYKTTLKFNLTKHMLQHYPEARQNFKLSSCSHCKATFKSKTSLDGHTLKKHPHVTSTVTSKIHKCTLCAYKTTLKFNLTKHMLRHYPEARQNFKLSSCNHCKATFKSKTSLDDHTLRKHPHVMSTVTSKIHKCTLCPYKTTSTFNLTKHMWQHYPETRQNFKLSFCSHCKATFKSKTSLDGHTLRKHPHVTSTVTSKIHKCTLCPYKTTLKSNLTKHMLQHYPEARQNFKLSSCSHCKATFKSKTSLDDHTLRKHPHVMSTVTSKIHKCTLCPYKTTMKFHLTKHMWQHYPETRQNFKLSSCSQCKATFKSKTSLDDHTLRKHPQVTSSVTCKIHKCTLCPYKTTSTFNLTKHMWQHSPETQQNFKLSSCSHCKATFKSKTSLDDHTLRKHRHVTSTVTSKIHKCTVCPYKTTLTFNLTKHMWQHYPETRQNFKLSSCSHCKATFKSKLALDDHTLRKHPHVTSTVTSKIHKCTFCPYKTTKKFNLTKHMLQHYPETRQNFKLSSCSHCKATFKSKLGLDDHTLRKHPHVTSTVASKIHKCTFCPYKTTKKFNLTKHMLQHYPETRQNFKLSSCSHCKATFKSKTSLDNHTLRKHPHVTSTVTSKIHKCTLCPYKTTRKYDLTCHMLQHYPKTVVTAKQHLKADEHNFVEAGSNIQLPEMQGKKIKVEENWEDYKSFEPLQFTEVDTIKLEKNDDLIDGNTEITLNGIKDEHNFVEPGSNIEVPELQEKKIKLEENWEDSIPFEPMYITNEDICKIKKNDDLIDENTKTTLNSDPQQEIQRQNLEVCKRSREELYSCYNCNYTTFYKNHLIKHMKLHCITKFASKKKIDATARKSTLDKHMLEHSETKDELKICIDCHMVFKNERWLVNHRNKEHSDSVQVFKCIHCKYKTTLKSSFDRHMLKHLGTTDDHMAEPISLDWYHCKHCTYKTSLKTNFERHMLKHSKREKRCRNVCRHCGLTLMSPRYLDEHMVRKHPDSIASITRKIYECKHCSYKTCLNDRLSKHNKIQHPETVDSSKLHNCIHCGASFKCKRSMDEHIIRRHPDFIASVSSKIHACKYCTYKSTVTHSFEQHMLKHSGATDRHKYRKCTECGAVFKNKVILDDHTIRKHPHVTSTVTNKIHECTLCPYKTTKRSRLTSHMLQHYPETCSHCKETFKSKLSLTEHIVRKHPQLTSTVTTKIHECTFCPYKTTKKSHIDWHMSHSQHSHSQHSQIKLMTTEGKLKKCNHCDAVYERKESLDDHIIRKHPDLIAYISRKIHTCKYCTFKSTVSSAMTKHMSRHSDTTDGSISSKIHECTLCSYKTTFKVILTRHMLRQHPETQESPELLSSCSQCKEAFRRKQALDEHILRKHPHVTSIVTSKIHECTLCSYKTTFKVNLTRHMLRLHPETQESPELLSSCSQCKATFRSKQALDEHTLQKHPHVTSTVTSKIHECTLCPYKTSMKNHFDRHISKHSQIE
ncbi:unnamed protein product [Callosobruchus maculatus]|uniref:C2H2-type domain-containing protein n=1 Tax=Callosobruchus maculatus TaxID=64391 RepID=A0A653CYB3_CALMS|nr:unnamed protein product [Callosobruchus maculatus]